MMRNDRLGGDVNEEFRLGPSAANYFLRLLLGLRSRLALRMIQLMIEIQVNGQRFQYAVRSLTQGYALFKFHPVESFRFYNERFV